MALFFAGCGAKRAAINSSTEDTEPQLPEWHTCLIQGAKATIRINDEQYAANITMQTVRDSMLVINVMPVFGIEMMRMEATPLEIIGIDKFHGQYIETSFAELNRKLSPSLNWDVLQQLCTAELPTGSQRARLVYSFGEDVVELVVIYPENRMTDVPVRVSNQPLNRYTRIDVSRWL